MGDLKLHEHLGLQADELVAGVQKRRLVVLLQPVGRGAHHISGNGQLLERAVIHEPEVGTVVVKVLHLLGLQAHGIELRAGVEGVVDHAAGLDVLELGAYKRAALARLHMLELDDGAHLAVVDDAHAVLEIGGRNACHGCFLSCSRAAANPPVGRRVWFKLVQYSRPASSSQRKYSSSGVSVGFLALD